MTTGGRARLPLGWLMALAAGLALLAGPPVPIPVLRAAAPGAAALALPFAVLAYVGGAVTMSGAAAGALVAVLVTAGLGRGGLLFLGTGLLVTMAATRFGRANKHDRGIAEPRRGRRAAGNIFANTSLAAGAAAFAGGLTATPSLLAVAALAAAVSDSVASEVGKALAGPTRSALSWRRVSPGTTGAISAGGTAAGAVAALALTGGAVALGLTPLAGWLLTAPSALAAVLAESFLAPLERRGWIDNDGSNFLCTAIAALLCLAGVHLSS